MKINTSIVILIATIGLNLLFYSCGRETKKIIPPQPSMSHTSAITAYSVPHF